MTGDLSEQRYPEGSHLSMAMLPAAHDDDESFRLLYTAVCAGVETRLNYVETIPREYDYDAVGEAPELATTIKITDSAAGELPYRDDDGQRLIRAYVAVEDVGPVVVTYEAAKSAKRHPVTAYFGDDVLGIPEEVWSEEDRAQAVKLYAWASRTFDAACTRTGALYGQLAAERPLPLPAELAEGTDFDGAVYLSAELIGAERSFVDSLHARYGDEVVRKVPGGVVLDGHVPFGETGVPVSDYPDFFGGIQRFVVDRLNLEERETS